MLRPEPPRRGRPRPSRRRRWGPLLAALVALALLPGGGVLWLRGQLEPLLVNEHCEAVVDLDGAPRRVLLSPEQAEHATTIAAVAVRRGLPARAVTIALATAYQESDLRNLDGGDRDSVGLFQQRPSQGWGTAAQLQDPPYAAGAFYDALVEVPGYRELPVTEAAQRVQRSAFPTAYADHEDDARVLASALTGRSAGAFTCTVDGPRALDAEAEDAAGLTPRARRVLGELRTAFGDDLPVGGFAPPGEDTGRAPGSVHADGLAVDVFFRPVGDAAQRARGWAVASWLLAHAERLDLSVVIFDDRIWSVRRSGQGWRPYEPRSLAAADRDTPRGEILRHLDHVHVDVQRGG